MSAFGTRLISTKNRNRNNNISAQLACQVGNNLFTFVCSISRKISDTEVFFLRKIVYFASRIILNKSTEYLHALLRENGTINTSLAIKMKD